MAIPPKQENLKQENLVLAKYFLASIVESSQDSIVTIDFDGIITTWNHAAEGLYGYRADEAIGQPLARLVIPQDLSELLSNIEHVKHDQQVKIFDSVRIHKNGQEMHLEVRMSPVRDEEGQVVGVSTIARDMTQSRQLEEEVQRAHVALQQTNDALEHRVAGRTQELHEEVTQKRLLQAQRTQLMERIVNVQEEERGRVSRELHDNLGQHLTAILLGIEALETHHGALPEEARMVSAQGLARLYGMVNDLTIISHRLAWELRPAVLDNIGLPAALEQYTTQWSGQGITADFVSPLKDNETGLSSEAETALYRVTQEALTNVQRHANASQVSVVLEHKPGSVSVIIEDNGRGFDVEEAASKNRLGVVGMRERMELVGMCERMELVGGTLEVESEPGGGTTVYARVPLNSSSSEKT